MGTRMFQLDAYENDQVFNRLLCTSTLLEGVNTTAKNIVITKPARNTDKNIHNSDFSAFDFYNLVGRTGRLHQHFIGRAIYLRTPKDPNYRKIDAIRSVRFELTDNSKDIDIQKGSIENHPDVNEFLERLGISLEEYLLRIGSKLRFETVKGIYFTFCVERQNLIEELKKYVDDQQRGRLYLVKILLKISEGSRDDFKANIITNLLDKRRPRVKKVVNDVRKYFKEAALDSVISTVIRMKTSYIEHQFYAKVQLIKYFLELSNTDESLISVINTKILGTIEYLYFSTSKQKKMLVDLGIYERDVDSIIKVIGEDFDDVFELKNRLRANCEKFKSVSFISKYVIQNLTK